MSNNLFYGNNHPIEKSIKEIIDKPYKGKYLAECATCEFYDTVDETCTNERVLEFDMGVNSNGKPYCVFWQHVGIIEFIEGSRRKGKKDVSDFL